MGKYHMDTTVVTVKSFYQVLSNSRLLPGEGILKEEPQKHLVKLEKKGIETLEQLIKSVKTPKKLQITRGMIPSVEDISSLM